MDGWWMDNERMGGWKNGKGRWTVDGLMGGWMMGGWMMTDGWTQTECSGEQQEVLSSPQLEAETPG